jgi:hypothetical protein
MQCCGGISLRLDQGRIQDFKLEGADLKKLRRAEGGAKMFWVFRVENHDFTPKNHIFSNFRRGGGARAGCAPPGSAPVDFQRNFLLCISGQSIRLDWIYRAENFFGRLEIQSRKFLRKPILNQIKKQCLLVCVCVCVLYLLCKGASVFSNDRKYVF